MNHEVFTQKWAQAWADELRASTGYRRAAMSWEGSIILEMEADPKSGIADDRAVFLDLWHGDCRGAWIPLGDDRADAAYIIRASAGQWRKVLGGQLEPLMAIMSGKLKLERGSLAKLTPHVKAAQELLAAARRVPSFFPGEEPGSGGAVEAAEPTESPTPEGVLRFAPSAAAEVSPSEADDKPAELRQFQTTSPRGLNYDLPPMRLWKKAKRFGIWDPFDIDFTRDQQDWAALDERQRELILLLTSQFQAGEESVTLDLLPLIMTIAREGRLEEEMYLTSFLWEEAKHVEVFRRFFDEVTEEKSDLSRYHAPAYKEIFYEKLPRALNRLGQDASPVAQAEASVTYNMIVEGVLAETGYHSYHSILAKNDLMPGMQQAVAHLKNDESRHMAYGVFLLSRLVAEHGERVWQAIETKMGELLPIAIRVVEESFESFGDDIPFGLCLSDLTDFAQTQFERRLRRIETSRRQSLEEVCRLPVFEEADA